MAGMDNIPVTWAVLGLLAFCVMQGAAAAALYYGLKGAIAAVSGDVKLALVTERADRREEHATLEKTVLGLIGSLEAVTKELSRRVGTLESGQDEWTKALRKRTHELADQLNALALKVDRLERPANYQEHAP